MATHQKRVEVSKVPKVPKGGFDSRGVKSANPFRDGTLTPGTNDTHQGVTEFVLSIRALPEFQRIDCPVRRLRALLKVLKRGYGFEAVTLRPSEQAIAPHSTQDTPQAPEATRRRGKGLRCAVANPGANAGPYMARPHVDSFQAYVFPQVHGEARCFHDGI